MYQTGRIYHGTTQQERYPEALKPEYVQIDEFDFQDLLLFTSTFSHLLSLYDATDKPDGNCSQLLVDDIFILAEIAKFDTTTIDSRFKQTLLNFNLFRRSEKKIKFLFEAIDVIFVLAQLFDYWLTKLILHEKQVDKENTLREEIDLLFKNHLTSEFEKTTATQKLLTHKTGYNHSSEVNITELKHFNTKDNDTPTEELSDVELLRQSAKSIEESYLIFYQALHYLKQKAPDLFTQSMKRSSHLPHIGLFLTFLKLFKYAQTNLNEFKERFVDYYFRNTLKLEQQGFRPDTTYLYIELNDQVKQHTIYKDEKFVAGEDLDGNRIMYKAVDNVRLNRAFISKLYGFSVNNSYLNIKGIPHSYLSGIYAIEYPQTIYIEKNNKIALPIFARELGVGSKMNYKTTNPGFAFSSKNLFLSKGERDVKIDMWFTPESFKTISNQIDNFSIAKRKLREEVRSLLLLHAFEIWLTSEQGWYNVRRYAIAINETGSVFTFYFTIPANAPAIVAFDPEKHTGNFCTQFPVIKVYLSSNAYIYAYSQISKLELTRIDISVDVQGFRDLKAYNHYGELETNNTFFPFGTMPKRGHYFIIGSNEVFKKELTALKVNWRWFELPEAKSGFKVHYQNYKVEYSNDIFKIRISILDNGKWKPEYHNQQEFQLFDEDDNKELEPEATLEEIDIKRIYHDFDEDGYHEELEYSQQAFSGFIKLTLSAPSYGFGHDIYPTLITEAAKQKKGGILSALKNQEDTTVLPPFAPQIEQLSVDYSSTSSFLINETINNAAVKNQSNEHFYHLYPYGDVLVFPNLSTRKVELLPPFEFNGSFLIGLKMAQAGETVSFLFHIKENYAESSEQFQPEINWQYLKNDCWYNIDPSKVYVDETDGFQHTGIIILELPNDIEAGNTQIDSNLLWIRANIMNDSPLTGNLFNVYTQAFKVVFDSEQMIDKKLFGNILPVKSISISADTIAEVALIHQPLQSFDGQKHETVKSFYQRAIERIHHRNRAITSDDFEKIILSKFPEIEQVTCFPNMSDAGDGQSQHVLIVVIPKNIDQEQAKAGSKLLVEIRNHIHKIASPFIAVDIRNPVYEYVKISCSVSFKAGFSQGYYIQELHKNLNDFLNNYFKQKSGKLTLGGTLYVADVISYLRTLYYIDTVGRLSLIHIAKDFLNRYVINDTASQTTLRDYIQATKPWAVLVPYEEHIVGMSKVGVAEYAEPTGVGQLKIGNEFVIFE